MATDILSKIPPCEMVFVHYEMTCQEAKDYADNLEDSIVRCTWQNAESAFEIVAVYCKLYLQDKRKNKFVPPPLIEYNTDEDTLLAAMKSCCAGERSMDTMSYITHCVRIKWLAKTLKPAVCTFAVPDVMQIKLLQFCKLMADASQYTHTQDLYVHAMSRCRLAPWITEWQPLNDPPYVMASRVYGDTTNDVIRPLIDMDVSDYIMTTEEWEKDNNFDMFVIMCTLILECLGSDTAKLLINHETGLWDSPLPMLGMWTNLKVGNAYGFVENKKFYYYKSAPAWMSVAAWLYAVLARPPQQVPRSIRQLCEAIVDPETVTNANPYMKYVTR